MSTMISYLEYKQISEKVANDYWQEVFAIPESYSIEEVKRLKKEAMARMNAVLDNYSIIPVQVNHSNPSIVEIFKILFTHTSNGWYKGLLIKDSYFLYGLLTQYAIWKEYPTKYDDGAANRSFIYEKEGELSAVIQYCEGDICGRIDSRRMLDLLMQEQ